MFQLFLSANLTVKAVLFCVTRPWLLFSCLLFFLEEMKGKESGFGKVVLRKGIVNDWRSNGWGCGEPSIRAPENEVEIKANVYLRTLFAFEPLNGLIPFSTIHCDKKRLPPPSCRGEQLVGGKTFGLSSVMTLTFWKVLLSTVVLWLLLFTPPDAGKCRAPSLCHTVGLSRFF